MDYCCKVGCKIPGSLRSRLVVWIQPERENVWPRQDSWWCQWQVEYNTLDWLSTKTYKTYAPFPATIPDSHHGPALRSFGLQRDSSNVRLCGPRWATVSRILQVSIETNTIWYYLELQLYDNYMFLDPPPNKWKARWNRLRIMFWMVIAPELVLAWEVRQRFAAREIRDAYNERQPGGYTRAVPQQRLGADGTMD